MKRIEWRTEKVQHLMFLADCITEKLRVFRVRVVDEGVCLESFEWLRLKVTNLKKGTYITFHPSIPCQKIKTWKSHKKKN